VHVFGAERGIYLGAESSQNDRESIETPSFEIQTKLVEGLKVQWKLMWSERYNDKAKAEGVSVHDYVELAVERGTILYASRDFKPLNFQEVLKANKIEKPDRHAPNAAEGGWNKFIQASVRSHRDVKSEVCISVRKSQQSKKGRGWLHSV
jgi:hypothetical protein